MRDMDNILPNDEFKEVENRYYANPQTSLDRANTFIDNLRSTQAQQNQQIARDTYNLGTRVPSVQGGLGTNTPAVMSYFTSRMQTPQTNSAVANLRATAQATALNQVLQNEQEMWKKRYNDAYRAYQKRASSSAGSGSNLEEILKRLGIITNPDDANNDDTVSLNPNSDKTGTITGVQGNLELYSDANGGKWTLRNLQSGDDVLLGGLTHIGGNLLRSFPDGTPLENGAVYDAGGGRVFMYIKDAKYPNGTIFRVGDTPLVSYK